VEILMLTKKTTTAMLSAAALLVAQALTSIPAFAHHGWATFDTTKAFFIQGTVTEVRWGNPHSEVQIRIESTAIPTEFGQRELPPGADEENARLTFASARPYDGEHKAMHLILAGPGWMSRWGLDRPLEVGEKIEAVGYAADDGHDELRPVMFWLESGQGVWQQLTAFPSTPEPVQNSNP
jgi:hypothetical protein